MTDEAQFRQQLSADGYGDVQFKDYPPNNPPNNDGPMHTHDCAVRLLIMSGEFLLAEEGAVTVYRPGDICDVAPGIRHVERAGPDGARVLLGKK